MDKDIIIESLTKQVADLTVSIPISVTPVSGILETDIPGNREP